MILTNIGETADVKCLSSRAKLEETKKEDRRKMGPYVSAMMEMTFQKPKEKQQQYSLSMISAISQDRIIAN